MAWSIGRVATAAAGVSAARIDLVAPDGPVADSRSFRDIPGIAEDVRPVRIDCELEGIPADHSGWRVVVDPTDEVAEIYEGNNDVTLTEVE